MRILLACHSQVLGVCLIWRFDAFECPAGAQTDKTKQQRKQVDGITRVSGAAEWTLRRLYMGDGIGRMNTEKALLAPLLAAVGPKRSRGNECSKGEDRKGVNG